MADVLLALFLKNLKGLLVFFIINYTLKMAYIIYHLGSIVGCYGNIDLLRLNLLILCFKLKLDDKINNLVYENIVEALEHPEFDEFSFQNTSLKKDLIDENIRVQVIHYEGSAHIVLENILKHIEQRFYELRDKLYLDARVNITIPGSDPHKHDLGTMYEECWKFVDKENYKQLYNTMHDYISSKIIELIESFGIERVKFGDVYYQNATATNYQLWSANAVNWDLPEGSKIPGSYQALSMKIQVPGVFGIVVNPRYGYLF